MGINIKETIEKELGSLEDFVVLVSSTTENYYGANIAVLDYLVNTKGMSGVYITMNKPYFTLVNTLKNSNIDSNKLFFIDMVSGVIGQESETDNCMLLESPAALGDLGISILKAYETGKFNFLFLDSLSTMLVYNNVQDSLKFSHHLITQTRRHCLEGVIMSLERDIKENPLLDSIIQFCDKHIKIE